MMWREKIINVKVFRRKGNLKKKKERNTKTVPKHQEINFIYFGCIRRRQWLEKHILGAKLEGKRGWASPSRTWEELIENWFKTTTKEAGRMAGHCACYHLKVGEAMSEKRIRSMMMVNKCKHGNRDKKTSILKCLP